MESKKIYESKTVFLNVLLPVVVIFVPQAQEFVVNNPEIAAAILGGLNALVRLVTKKKIELF